MGRPRKVKQEMTQEEKQAVVEQGDWLYAHFPDGRTYKIPAEYVRTVAKDSFPDTMCDTLTAAAMLRWSQVRNRAIELPRGAYGDDDQCWTDARKEVR